MEQNKVEYIQDIAFNDTCDRMVIATTSKQVIIYKKVLKSSDYLIIREGEQKGKDKSDIDVDIFYKKQGSIFDLEEDDNNDTNENNNSNKKVKKKNSLFKSTSLDGKINLINDYLKDFNDDNDKYDMVQNTSFQKNKEFEYRWEQIQKLYIDGPVLRIQWANSEFGNVFACSGYNKWIYIFTEEKINNNLVWKPTPIKTFTDTVIDISFLPKIHSLQLASVTLDGYLKISRPVNSNWETNILKEFNTSCTCLCCNPSYLDPLTIVIGFKKSKEEKKKESNKNLNKITDNNIINDLIKIAFFKGKSKPIIQSINESGHEDDITDVDWANQNGRSYHMICSTAKDGKFIIWEITFLEDEEIIGNDLFSYKKIFEFIHTKPLWRCCFNDSGIIASCIDEDGEVFVFLKIARNKFIKLDIEKTK